ncbi:hypothetical protein LSAT2_017116 [Lamellibrachia satsuma]|nr:hypothetical protein LSAT2_017116 [Lamellibrachia satsuma]
MHHHYTPRLVALASFKVISVEMVEPLLQYIHRNNFDTMGQLWTPSLVSRTSPRRSELVVVHPSAEIFPEAYGAAAARNNFGGPRVNNIKGHFNQIALAYPHFVCWYR